MKVQAADILGAITTLNYVPSRSGVRSSEVVKVVIKKAKMLLMLASEIKGCVSVPVEGGEPGEVYVDRSKFISFLQLAKGHKLSAFTFEVAEGKGGKNLTVKYGRRQAVYGSFDPVAGYSEVGPLKDETEIPLNAELIRLVELAAKYTTTDFTRPELNGVHLIRKPGMVCASKIGAINFGVSSKGITADTPLPEEYSQILGSASKVYVSRDGCRLEFPNGSLFRSYNPDQWSGKISKMPKLFEEFGKLPAVITCDSSTLLSALSRLKSCCGEDADYPVQMIPQPGEKPTLELIVKGPTWSFSEILRGVELRKASPFDLPLFHLLPILEQQSNDVTLTLHFEQKGDAGYCQLGTTGLNLLMCRTQANPAPSKKGE